VASTAVVADDGGARQQAVARRVLRELRRALRVDGIEFVLIGPAGRLVGAAARRRHRADLHVADLQAGRTTSGSHGDLVWAAAPQAVANSTAVAVVTADRQRRPVDGDDVVPRRRRRDPRASARRSPCGSAGGSPGRCARRARPPTASPTATWPRACRRRPTARRRARRAVPLRQRDGGQPSSGPACSTSSSCCSISHDLRTPLTSIRGYAEAIGDGAAPDPADAAAVIAAEAERLDRLVADLLTLRRLDGRAFALHPVAHDLTVPVNDAVRAFLPAGRSAVLDVAVRPAGTPATVPGRPRAGAAGARQPARQRVEVRPQPHRRLDRRRPRRVAGARSTTTGRASRPTSASHVFERLVRGRAPAVRAEVGSGSGWRSSTSSSTRWAATCAPTSPRSAGPASRSASRRCLTAAPVV
jgi:hypothetical protein